jgi:hypothetical protein
LEPPKPVTTSSEITGQKQQRPLTLAEFKQTLNNSSPPEVNDLLQALWYDAKGDWNRAHEIAQDVNTREGAWVHAFLHRKEGDRSNAAYWYGQAGKPMSNSTLDEEWEFISAKFLKG